MNDREQADYDFLKQTHAGGKMMGMADSEIVKLAKMNGDIEPAAMKQYCADHGETV